MSNTSYLWTIKENVLGVEVPQDHAFNSIGVIWHGFTDHCTAAANLPSTKEGVHSSMVGFKEDNSPFANLEELRKALPKLFEVKGEFCILQR